jgi:uncharacterized lipoprotein NlpE involved in copper resistance
MKSKISILAGLALVSITLVGCGSRSEENTPATSTSAPGNQPMPDATVSNAAITPPGAVWNNTNNPTPTNAPDTNNPGAPN